MASEISTIAQAILVILLIIDLALNSYVVSKSHDYFPGHSIFISSVYGVMLFISIWSVLVLAYISVTPVRATQLYHKLVAIVLIGLTTLFWFAGSIAMVNNLRVTDCHHFSGCMNLQAAIAFGFVTWIAFLTALVALSFLKGGAKDDPTTSQPHPAV